MTEALDILPAHRYPLPDYDVLIAHPDQVLERARALAPVAAAILLDRVKLLSPVANLGKITSTKYMILGGKLLDSYNTRIGYGSMKVRVREF